MSVRSVTDTVNHLAFSYASYNTSKQHNKSIFNYTQLARIKSSCDGRRREGRGSLPGHAGWWGCMVFTVTQQLSANHTCAHTGATLSGASRGHLSFFSPSPTYINTQVLAEPLPPKMEQHIGHIHDEWVCEGQPMLKTLRANLVWEERECFVFLNPVGEFHL